MAAGEGSRGGKVIGHTRGGKPIYASVAHASAAAGLEHNGPHARAAAEAVKQGRGDLVASGAIKRAVHGDSSGHPMPSREHLVARSKELGRQLGDHVPEHIAAPIRREREKTEDAIRAHDIVHGHKPK